MDKKKIHALGDYTKDGSFCVKCGSNVPYDEVGHKCELINCPEPKQKTKK